MHRLSYLIVIGALAVAVSVVAAGPAAGAKGGNKQCHAKARPREIRADRHDADDGRRRVSR